MLDEVSCGEWEKRMAESMKKMTLENENFWEKQDQMTKSTAFLFSSFEYCCMPILSHTTAEIAELENLQRSFIIYINSVIILNNYNRLTTKSSKNVLIVKQTCKIQQNTLMENTGGPGFYSA